MKVYVIPNQMRLGIFFGSFDPIHTNHIAMCLYLLNHGYLDGIYIVPNGDNNPFKRMTPLRHRVEMVRLAIAAGKGNMKDIYIYQVEPDCKMSWRDRGLIAKNIKKQHALNNRIRLGQIQLFQLIGQDSYETAINRCKVGTGIYGNLNRKLMVLMRGNCDDLVIPKSLENVTVVITDYKDPIKVSSTMIRNTRVCDLTTDKVDPNVISYIKQNNLYAPKKVDRLMIMGGCGTGKSTMCQHLIQQGWVYYSTGDCYRKQKEENTVDYQRLESILQQQGKLAWVQQLVKFMHTKIDEFIEQHKGRNIVIDGMRPDDLSNYQQYKDNTLVVYLTAQRDCLYHRLLQRNRDDDSIANVNYRLDMFYKRLPYDMDKLRSSGFQYRVVDTTEIDFLSFIVEITNEHQTHSGTGTDQTTYDRTITM